MINEGVSVSELAECIEWQELDDLSRQRLDQNVNVSSIFRCRRPESRMICN